jgi:hypothetical protein
MVEAMQQESNNRVTFGPRSGLTEEEARDIRVRALRFVLDCYDRKKAAALAALMTPKGDLVRSAPQQIIPNDRDVLAAVREPTSPHPPYGESGPYNAARDCRRI